MAVSFIGWGNQNTRRKPHTCRRSLTKFYHIMLYGVHLSMSRILNYHTIMTTTGPFKKYKIVFYIFWLHNTNIICFSHLQKIYWTQQKELWFFFIVQNTFCWNSTVKPAHAVTCIKRSLFSCLVENFIWIKPLLRSHLSYKATISLSQMWPLNTRLTVCEYCDTMEPVIYLTTCYICIYIMCTFV